jgi:hypothetical protein
MRPSALKKQTRAASIKSARASPILLASLGSLASDAFATLNGGTNKVPEQRMRAVRAAFELRVRLAGHIPRMLRQLNHLNKPLIGRKS